MFNFDAVRRLLERTLGGAADRFSLQPLANDRFDTVEIEAAHGTVRLAGNSPTALSRGAYHYLREHGHRQDSWSGEPIALPSPLPDCPLTRLESRVRSRHFGSVCVYGYSAVWWDWERWERELDWMALHGVNQPLLLAGQEAICRRVFLRLGLTDAEIAAHFSGPAYLCWHRLGNLNGYMGPLPQDWIDGQELLQAKIMDRARQLGMEPIVPGFSGFVPESLTRVFPDTRLMSAEPWAGFEPTTYLDPLSDAFREIGRLSLEEYRRAYGPAHHYLCELFAEQRPCLEAETEIEELSAIGRATWQTLERFDSDATWVMQGWPFYFDREYWQPHKTESLLEAVPAGRLMVLDLATEELETYKLQPALPAKGWSFNVVHNYGQNTHLHGHLQGFVDRAEAALRDPLRGRLVGMGVSPEGIDQNPVVYELLSDIPWGPVEMTEWVRRYAHARYGRAFPDAERAWSLLLGSIYGPEGVPHPRYSWRFRPGDQPLVASPDPLVLQPDLEALLAVPLESSNYRRDVVDVAKTWLGAITDRLLEQALETREPARFFEALADLDRLLATRPEHRLSTWLNSAPAGPLYQRNARALITHWGGPFLFDYAIKEWAGLTLDFHAERWRMWFKDPSSDFAAREQEWSQLIGVPKESSPSDEIETAQELLAKYRGVPLAPDRVPQVHRLDPQTLRDESLVIDLPSRMLVAVACVPIFGQGFKGRYRMEIDGESIPPYHSAPATCRGIRFRFDPRSVRSLRFSIEAIQGSPEQMFQVVLFEPV